MTQDWNNDGEREGHKRVVDEEQTVDKQIKNQILKLRQRVSDREDLVFTQAPLDPEIGGLGRAEQVEIWKTSVVQYLERIEPLLQSDEIERSTHFYREAPLADRTVYPPDGQTPVLHNGDVTAAEIRWSLLKSDNLSKREIVTNSDHFGRGVEPPEPRRFSVTGLKEVIEKPSQAFEWEVVLNPEQVGPERKIARPSVQASLSKDELKKAVRLADTFLHEHAGIGVNVGHEETDDPEDNPF